MIADHVGTADSVLWGVEQAERELASGRTVIVLHDAGAAIVFPAASATPAAMSFAVRHSSGFVQVALAASQCDRLLIPPAAEMYGRRAVSTSSRQRVGVDAVEGIGTGISAADRARTARVLADSTSLMTDLTRPGHVIPVSVSSADSQEMSVAGTASSLVGSATGNCAAVFAEIILDVDPVDLPTRLDVVEFARVHGICTVDSADLGSPDRYRSSSVDRSYST
ncbi:3,4-dihydroxy-2-butanone-4-phosphate synthase (plasmid) [Rhodococcus sp. USK10]|uniref:3,4-dihydroxy-2-butanone-4-phosphate synthase n=1 Tax=Rhodococcus sp. USK10 TaxID=2789739 RepID=UPI001C5D4438|nr:3,4-dihydroxy-2-butanone-4-phosphate synthase [Rhodococcus sp. USK10]QYB00568.1 3,4-dihydroxy-2-butanone-4-phosphate synthase [Rhodococcus sp. USK10]